MSHIPEHFAKEFQVRGYITAFVDLLGLSNTLVELDQIYDNADEAHVRSIVKRSFAPVRNVRKAFEDFYRAFEGVSGRTVPEGMESLGPEFQRIWKEGHKHEAVLHWFSDCVSVSVPISDSNVTTMHDVVALFGSLSSTMLQMLLRRQPVRGGVAIGYGAEITKGEIVGSSLAHAYSLESKVAKWPRIVVGAGLVKMLEKEAAATGNTPEEKTIIGLASHALSLVFRDLDGEVSITPFSEAALMTFALDDRIQAAYIALSFAHSALTRYSREGNATLAERYEMLFRSLCGLDPAQYFEGKQAKAGSK